MNTLQYYLIFAGAVRIHHETVSVSSHLLIHTMALQDRSSTLRLGGSTILGTWGGLGQQLLKYEQKTDFLQLLKTQHCLAGIVRPAHGNLPAKSYFPWYQSTQLR